MFSDMHVAALRTLLVQGPAVWAERYEEQLKHEDDFGFSFLMNSALARAAHRRFSPTYSLPQIIRYVADVRLGLGEGAHEVNPQVAEGLLRHALGDPTLSARPPFGADQATMVRAQLCLLIALVFEEDPDDAELEQFVDESAEYAAEWLAAWRDTSPLGRIS
ncbi:hypothetical protein [Actinomadura sp. WMMA1423]|uniref:hypothetical protein n=1 Tax=Actinomadura sp. WMMA1423 TaxID=2591108 RepID=UPI00114644C3|nr:hypothetical protein [Actinomadura sp. WMMA1423]